MKEEEIEIDLKIYSLEIIFASAYAMLDKGYFFIDKNVKKKDVESIIVRFASKDEKIMSTDRLKHEFFDQLINHSVYYSQFKETKKIKEYILKEVFENSIKKEIPKNKQQQKEEIFNFEGSIDDPEGILIPWEEKYKNSK